MWSPVIIALVLAYLFSPVVTFFQNRIPFGGSDVRRTLATFLTFVTSISLIVTFLLLIVPAIIEQMGQFGEAMPALLERMGQDLEVTLSRPLTIGNRAIVPLDIIGSLDGIDPENPFPVGEIDLVTTTRDLLVPLGSPVLGALGTVVSGAVTTIFVLTMGFYLLKDGPHFVAQIEELVSESYREDMRVMRGRLGNIWNAYLRGQLILSFTMGVLVFLSATILGVRSPLVLGTLSAVLEFVPNIGPVIALVPAMLFALFFPSTTIVGLDGLLFMLVVIGVWTALQNIESVYLVPRIMGDSLDLHPFVVIVAVIGGAALAGVLGVILAAPVVATLRLLIDYFYIKIVRLDVTRPDLVAAEVRPTPVQAESIMIDEPGD